MDSDTQSNDEYKRESKETTTNSDAKLPPLFSLGVMNCRSAKNKSCFINDYILENNFDCVALTETWLRNGDEEGPLKNKLV